MPACFASPDALTYASHCVFFCFLDRRVSTASNASCRPKSEQRLPAVPTIDPAASPTSQGGRQPAPPKGGGPPGKVRHNDPNAVVNKKVDKAVKLIRSILSSWDSSLRKTFNTIDADRGGTIDLEEFSNFLNRVLHLNFDDETMRGIMAKFGSGA